MKGGQTHFGTSLNSLILSPLLFYARRMNDQIDPASKHPTLNISQIMHLPVSVGGREIGIRRNSLGKRNMTKTKKPQNPQNPSFMKELRNYEISGTRLYLGNRPSRADDIVHACMVAEKSVYMRDIICDEKDRITEIHFIKIPSDI